MARIFQKGDAASHQLHSIAKQSGTQRVRRLPAEKHASMHHWYYSYPTLPTWESSRAASARRCPTARHATPASGWHAAATRCVAAADHRRPHTRRGRAMLAAAASASRPSVYVLRRRTRCSSHLLGQWHAGLETPGLGASRRPRTGIPIPGAGAPCWRQATQSQPDARVPDARVHHLRTDMHLMSYADLHKSRDKHPTPGLACSTSREQIGHAMRLHLGAPGASSSS